MQVCRGLLWIGVYCRISSDCLLETLQRSATSVLRFAPTKNAAAFYRGNSVTAAYTTASQYMGVDCALLGSPRMMKVFCVGARVRLALEFSAALSVFFEMLEFFSLYC